ncbi:MAG: trans-aconitate 2-methyltransferase [Myxococcales bacterium]|nr:class I SAM-dependent methyltransferase [Myxococcales bacterium]
MSYAEKIEQEIANYRHVENVHDLPAIFHYWSNKHLLPKMKSLGLDGIEATYVAYARRAAPPDGSELRILSVGAGNCDSEIAVAGMLAKTGFTRFRVDCLDVNPFMLKRGAEAAAAAGQGSRFRFIESDVNHWTIAERYHLVIANQSLHHFVDLEVLFDKIAQALDPEGFFVSSDMIGRNGHMRWPEALEQIQRLWTLLDDRHRYNHQLKRLEPVYENWDCSKEGFEGIRAQDVLPLLMRRFQFDLFFGFGNLIDIFTDRGFGHNFDPNDPRDCAFIDYVTFLDDYLIERGLLSPTHMIAAMTSTARGRPRVYKHLTPEFCLRRERLDTPPEPRRIARPLIESSVGWARRSGLLRYVPRALKQSLKKMLEID